MVCGAEYTVQLCTLMSYVLLIRSNYSSLYSNYYYYYNYYYH